MSKKIPVLNSPWGREYERPSDCARWIEQGHAEMIGNAMQFSEHFIESIIRQAVEFDPTGYDDGTARRWVRRDSGDIPVLQLRPVKQVGTAKGVEHKRDELTRRQYGRDKGRSVMAC